MDWALAYPPCDLPGGRPRRAPAHRPLTTAARHGTIASIVRADVRMRAEHVGRDVEVYNSRASMAHETLTAHMRVAILCIGDGMNRPGDSSAFVA
jgi:hypothetical protein